MDTAAAATSTRPGLRLVLGLGVLLLLAGIGAVAYLLNPEKGPEQAAPPVATPTATPPDISSRDLDPAPLTVREVFPDGEIVPETGQPGYQIIDTHATRDCRRVAVDDLDQLLGQLGCSQVVYGSLRTPDGTHLINAGILNLVDSATARQAYQDLRPMLNERRGGFQPPRPDERATGHPASSRTGWQARGHFLLYCVLVRVDGALPQGRDQSARQIFTDLIERHFTDVLENRTRAAVTPDASD